MATNSSMYRVSSTLVQTHSHHPRFFDSAASASAQDTTVTSLGSRAESHSMLTSATQISVDHSLRGSQALPVTQTAIKTHGLQTGDRHMCGEHMKKYCYSCMTCNGNICSECLGNPSNHRGHRFQRYSEKKQDLRVLCQQIHRKIRIRRQFIVDNINKLNVRQQQSLQSEQASIHKITAYTNRLAQLQQHNIVEASLDQPNCVQYLNKLKQFNSFYQQQLQRLRNESRVGLLSCSGDTIQTQTAEKINQVTILDLSRKQKTVRSFIRPDPSTNQFVITDFTLAKQHRKQLLLESFQSHNSIWRLKVYPGGYSGVKADQKHQGIDYMSVYIERLDGILEQATYIVSLQLTSKNNPNIKVKKQFQSEYLRRESWGYDRYTRVSNIYEYGFLGADDSLQIRVHISQKSYPQAVKELTRVVEERHRVQEQNERRIKILRIMVERKKLVSSTCKSEKMVEYEQIQTAQSVGLAQLQQHQSADHTPQRQTPAPTPNNNKLQQSTASQPNSPSPSCRVFRCPAIVRPQLRDKSTPSRQSSVSVSRSRTHFPEIVLEPNSPGKLIRLVSLKNAELIENSKKGLLNRSSTYF